MHETTQDAGHFGVYAAILTPLRGGGAVDLPKLADHAGWLLENGCHGIALFGTTGEAPSFSLEEREATLCGLIDRGLSPDRILVGTGCCAVPDTVRLTRHALAQGCRKVLLIPPYFFKGVSEDGLFEAYAQVFSRVADERLEAYLYHFPDMSAVSLSRDLITRLRAAFPTQLVGLKDSSGKLENMRELINAFPGFQVVTGDDDLLLPLLRMAGAGSLSAGANLAPDSLRYVFEGWRSGGEEVERHQRILESLWSNLLLRYPVTEALKEIIAAETGESGWLEMRPPLARLSADDRATLLRKFRGYGLRVPFA